VRRLTKRAVETLLQDFDDDPVGALTTALRIVLDRPDDDFDALIAHADLDEQRRQHLLRRDWDALDELAAELNERRTL
jgi:hypothetical protein